MGSGRGQAAAAELRWALLVLPGARLRVAGVRGAVRAVAVDGVPGVRWARGRRGLGSGVPVVQLRRGGGRPAARRSCRGAAVSVGAESPEVRAARDVVALLNDPATG